MPLRRRIVYSFAAALFVVACGRTDLDQPVDEDGGPDGRHRRARHDRRGGRRRQHGRWRHGRDGRLAAREWPDTAAPPAARAEAVTPAARASAARRAPRAAAAPPAPRGRGGTTGAAGRGGTTAAPAGVGGATGAAGRGGTTGSAGRGGTTGAAARRARPAARASTRPRRRRPAPARMGGRGGTAGRGGTTGSAGRGGTTGTAGTGGQPPPVPIPCGADHLHARARRPAASRPATSTCIDASGTCPGGASIGCLEGAACPARQRLLPEPARRRDQLRRPRPSAASRAASSCAPRPRSARPRRPTAAVSARSGSAALRAAAERPSAPRTAERFPAHELTPPDRARRFRGDAPAHRGFRDATALRRTRWTRHRVQCPLNSLLRHLLPNFAVIDDSSPGWCWGSSRSAVPTCSCRSA